MKAIVANNAIQSTQDTTGCLSSIKSPITSSSFVAPLSHLSLKKQSRSGNNEAQNLEPDEGKCRFHSCLSPETQRQNSQDNGHGDSERLHRDRWKVSA